MNFLRYDPVTGFIINVGFQKEEIIRKEVDAGKPTLLFPRGLYDDTVLKNKMVDVNTKQLIDKPIIEEPASYQDQRADSYPHLGILVDAIYWKERGDPSKFEKWLTDCDAVKAQFPKP